MIPEVHRERPRHRSGAARKQGRNRRQHETDRPLTSNGLTGAAARKAFDALVAEISARPRRAHSRNSLQAKNSLQNGAFSHLVPG
jgi:hypothetical protein